MMVAELFAGLGLKVDKGSFNKGSDAIGGIKKVVAAFLALEAVRKIGDLVMGTIDLGGHLDDLRQKTGLSAESLQAYGYAAKLGGSDLDSFASAVGKLSRTLSEAHAGSAEATKSLHAAGLTSSAVTAALKSGDGLDAALQEIADKFADMPDGAKKTALAMAIFGKSGAELIPTLNRGGDGLRDLKKEAYDLGVVMSEDNVSAADELGDNIDKLKMSAVGLKNQAIASLLPYLKELVDNTLAWVKANKQLIIDRLTTVVNGLVDALRVLGLVVGGVIDVFTWFGEHTEITEALLITLGSVIAAFAVEAAVNWVIAFAPLILAIGVVTAIVYGIRALWKEVAHGHGPVARFFQWVADKARWVGNALTDVWQWISDKFTVVVDGVHAGLDRVTAFFTDASAAVKRVWGEVLDWLDAKARAIADNKVFKAASYLAGNSAVADMTSNLANSTASRAQQHEAYGKRNSGDTRDFETWADDPQNQRVDENGQIMASTPHRLVPGGPTAAQGGVVDNSTVTINLTSTNADPKVVVDQFKQVVQDHWDSKMRAAHAGTGGADQ